VARVTLFPDAVDDIADLDGSDQRLVFKGLRKLETEPEKRGGPLGSGLTTFRKLVVGNRRIRIVYRVDENGQIAVVWVIASRADDECYKLAMNRLALYAGGETRTALEELVEEVFGPESQ
jgi:mRNA interferase RelE/StbE